MLIGHVPRGTNFALVIKGIVVGLARLLLDLKLLSWQMQQGCKRSKWVSTCLLKSFLAAIILPHVRHLNFTTPSSSCLAIIESRLALKSEKGDYVKKKQDTIIFCSFYFVGYTVSITYLSCLCHLDTWLVREFFVLKSFPQ